MQRADFVSVKPPALTCRLDGKIVPVFCYEKSNKK